MFVAGLDRAWLHTPFPKPGFWIERRSQLRLLRQYCELAFIDPRRDLNGKSDRTRQKSPSGLSTNALSRADRAVSRAFIDVNRGLSPHIPLFVSAAEELASAVVHDPDPLLWEVRTRPPGGLLRRRAVGGAILATILGHHLGLSWRRLVELALGGLLLDLGKTRVPVTILATPRRLQSGEEVFARSHVQEGCAILRQTHGVPTRSFTMVSNHHERMDGSGYPNGKRGKDIPLFARIGAVVDVYDALITDRGYALAVSPHKALNMLAHDRNQGLDAGLVDEFRQIMGIWPTGTTVELTDGSTGVVFAQDPVWPWLPKVAVVASADGRPRPHGLLAIRKGSEIVRPLDEEARLNQTAQAS